MTRTLSEILDTISCAVGGSGPQGFDMLHLCEGTVAAHNGALYAQERCGLAAGLDVRVPAALLQAAARACPTGAPVALRLTPAGRLVVQAGGFSARLPGVPPQAQPLELAPVTVVMKPDFLAALDAAAPFAASPGSGRPWAEGVHISDGHLYATDGIAAVQVDTDTAGWPALTLPAVCVAELLRRWRTGTLVDEVHMPGIGFTDTHVTFRFPGGGELRTSIVAGMWPRPPKDMFLKLDTLQPIPPGLAQAVKDVTPFDAVKTSPVVHLLPRGAVVVREPGGDEDAAAEGFAPDILNGSYRADSLTTVLAVATHADFAGWPVMHWAGKNCRGILAATRA